MNTKTPQHELNNIARRLADDVEATYLTMIVRQLREHAHRWRGEDGEKAMNDFANIIERTAAKAGDK